MSRSTDLSWSGGNHMSDWIGDLKTAKVVVKSNKLIVIAKKSKTETSSESFEKSTKKKFICTVSWKYVRQ